MSSHCIHKSQIQGSNTTKKDKVETHAWLKHRKNRAIYQLVGMVLLFVWLPSVAFATNYLFYPPTPQTSADWTSSSWYEEDAASLTPKVDTVNWVSGENAYIGKGGLITNLPFPDPIPNDARTAIIPSISPPTIIFQSGSSLNVEYGSSISMLDGTLNMNAGSLLNVDGTSLFDVQGGTVNLNGNTSISGTINNAGNFNVNESLSTSTFSMDGGTLTIASGKTLTSNGTFDYNDGILNYGGSYGSINLFGAFNFNAPTTLYLNGGIQGERINVGASSELSTPGTGFVASGVSINQVSGTLTVQAGDTLQPFTPYPVDMQSGGVYNNYGVSNYDGIRLYNNGGSVINHVTGEMNFGPHIHGNFTQNSGTFQNYGTLNFTGDSKFEISSGLNSFENFGTINKFMDTPSSYFNILSSQAFINRNGGVLNNNGTINGRIVNEGTIVGNGIFGKLNSNEVILNSGIVSPGNQGLGVIQTESYTEQGGKLFIEIGGANAPSMVANSITVGGYDLLYIFDGIPGISGIQSTQTFLEIDLINGFTPSPGDYFDVVIMSDYQLYLNGTYTLIGDAPGPNMEWVVVYNNTSNLPFGSYSIRLMAQATSVVPEPSTYLILGTMLMFVAMIRKTKKQTI